MDLVDRVFKVANDHRMRAEARGDGSEYLTIREIARRLRVTQAAVEEAAECGSDLGIGMALIVGVGVNGACAFYDRRGDYQVETWEEPV